jgi:hypothetical protein
MTTIYGPDVASYQGNVDWTQVRREGFDFAIVKCTEGDGYLNPHFVAQIDGAKAAGLLVAVYHFVKGDCSAQSQATWFASNCDPSWPVCLDSEDGSGNEGTNWAVACELQNLGYRLVFNYMPEWWWSQIGSPAIRFGPLWKSWYPDMNPGIASTIYARCPASAWSGYGGQDVALRQFTSSARIAGQVMDCSAFEGTRDELAALFGGTQHTQEDDMATPDEVWNEYLGSEGPWSQQTAGGALISLWKAMFGDMSQTDGMSPNSLLSKLNQLTRQLPSTVPDSTYTADGPQYAANADGYGHAANAKLDALTAAVAGLDSPSVDTNALASALAPMLADKVGALSDADLTRIAAAVADEQGRRLAS